MNGGRKAAVLLRNLDDALFARLLSMLSREQADVATRLVALADPARPEEVSSILLEFRARLQSPPVANRPVHGVAGRGRPSDVKEAPGFRQGPSTPATHGSSSDSTLVPAAPDLLSIDVRAVELPSPAAERVIDETPSIPAMAPSAPSLPAGPFAFLAGRHPDEIRDLLDGEQSQTIAVIAAHLTPALSAAVLAGLTPDRQAEVLQRVARLGSTDPAILDDVAEALKERLSRPRVRAGGVAQAAAVLRQSTRQASRSMLANIDDHDSDLADELRQTLFSFDDLLRLDVETLRVILQETDDRQWALALKASPEPVRQKVLSCLSQRIAQGLKDEMDSLGPVRLSEVTAVRQQIADSIRRLEDAGMIELPVHS